MNTMLVLSIAERDISEIASQAHNDKKSNKKSPALAGQYIKTMSYILLSLNLI